MPPAEVAASPGTPMAYDEAVGLRAAGPSRYEAGLDSSWWVDVGPNGGYLAAVLTRAAELEAARLGHDHRPASLSVHYLRAPSAGPAEVRTRLVRSGRTTTVLGLELFQGADNVVVTALITLTAPADGSTDGLPASASRAPDVPDIDQTPVRSLYVGEVPTYLSHWHIKPVVGLLPFTAPVRTLTDPIESAGWLRLVEDRPVDALLLATMADAWSPLIFGVIAEPILVPTLTFNLLWRGIPPEDARWCLTSLRTEAAASGLVDERVEICAESGELLLQGQQLSQLRPADRRTHPLRVPNGYQQASTRSTPPCE
jgi:Thioesterase-like superfamily